MVLSQRRVLVHHRKAAQGRDTKEERLPVDLRSRMGTHFPLGHGCPVLLGVCSASPFSGQSLVLLPRVCLLRQRNVVSAARRAWLGHEQIRKPGDSVFLPQSVSMFPSSGGPVRRS